MKSPLFPKAAGGPIGGMLLLPPAAGRGTGRGRTLPLPVLRRKGRAHGAAAHGVLPPALRATPLSEGGAGGGGAPPRTRSRPRAGRRYRICFAFAIERASTDWISAKPWDETGLRPFCASSIEAFSSK